MINWILKRLKKFADLVINPKNKNAVIQESKQTGAAQDYQIHQGKFRRQLGGTGDGSLPFESDNYDNKREPLQEGTGKSNGVPSGYLSEEATMELDLKDYKARALTPIVPKGFPETMYWVYDVETGSSKHYTDATNEETVSWICNLHGAATLNTPEMYTLLVVRATALDLAIMHKVATWSNLLGGDSLEEDDFLARDKKIRAKKDRKEDKSK